MHFINKFNIYFVMQMEKDIKRKENLGQIYSIKMKMKESKKGIGNRKLDGYRS